MGSIALPALDIRTPAQPDVLGNFARIQQIRQQQLMAPLQQQEAQQTIQQGALDLQQKQIALKDQQAMQKSMQEWGQPKSAASAPAAAAQVSTALPGQSGYGMSAPALGAPAAPQKAPDASSFNYEDLVPLAIKNGASFNAVHQLQTGILDMKAKAATIAMDDARAGSSNAETMKTKNGLIIDAMSSALSAPDQQLPQQVMSTAQELAGKGLLDPQHVQMAQQLAQSGDPNAIRQQLTMYVKSLGGFSQLLTEAQKKVDLSNAAGKTDPNSPLYAPTEQAVAMGTAPGAAQIQQGKTKQAASVAAADESARMPGEMRLAAQRQALTQGDPMAAAQLLVNGDATLSELKARGSTPQFIAQTLAGAHQLSGGKYNAQQADAAFQVAKSPAQVQFFGSAKSLTDPGGTLDQLAQVGKTVPQNRIPAFNTVADWEKAATGSGPVAEYAARALGVADDYAKVMGGGVGSDTSRLQALNLIAQNKSPEQRAAALNGIRGSVLSQTRSRIGSNPILQRMYGDVGSGSGPATGGNDPFAQFGGKAH